jgi:adenylate cyclase
MLELRHETNGKMCHTSGHRKPIVEHGFLGINPLEFGRRRFFVKRRLAAIFAADLVGYSRLIRADEEGTLTALKGLHKDAFEPIIAQYDGRIVKLMGDGVLVEFTSVVDAVRAAVQFQQSLSERNKGQPEERRLEFRIGVNLGDVVIDGEDIQGDGINIATRLEGLAKSGGICISDSVHDQVRDRLNIQFTDLGEQHVKNINRALRVWHWTNTPSKNPPDAVPITPVSGENERPSIAVLPFDNMSGEPEQEYFSDGITEDIITELCRFRNLFVIARNSSFTYKGQFAKVQDIARDLGVRYVVEGSVRKVANRIRVNVQLIDGFNGKHLWAERYDRDLEDIFAVQDEITQSVVSCLPGYLETAVAAQARRKQTANMSAYDYLLLGLEQFRRFIREQNVEARVYFQKAIELDPHYARAHALLASTDVWDVMTEWQDKPLDRAYEAVQVALSLDPDDGWSHAILAFILFLRKQDDESETEFQRAVALNNNDADIAAFMSNIMVYLGRWEEALQQISKAMRLNPHPPAWYHWYQAMAYFSGHRYEEAVRSFKEVGPHFQLVHAYLAACYVNLDRMSEARKELGGFTETHHNLVANIAGYAHQTAEELASERVDRYRIASDRKHLLDSLRKAGLNI